MLIPEVNNCCSSLRNPRSPYDPPARVLNATTEAMLPKVQLITLPAMKTLSKSLLLILE